MPYKRENIHPIRKKRAEMITRLHQSRLMLDEWDATEANAESRLTSVSTALHDVVLCSEGLTTTRSHLRQELRGLVSATKDAAALCRIVNSMRPLQPRDVMNDADDRDGTSIDVSVTVGHASDPMEIESAMMDVVPMDAAPTAGSEARKRNPIVSAEEESPRPSAVPEGTNEDDLVVLLLKRQLQRRELELKRLLAAEGRQHAVN